jgi:hypothetical protein
VFGDWYKQRHNGRNLSWHLQHGTADVRVQFASRVHELNVRAGRGVGVGVGAGGGGGGGGPGRMEGPQPAVGKPAAGGKLEGGLALL